MAIAKNFIKYPQAMALQFPLRFGKPKWNGSRPTTKLGREIRAYITSEVKRLGWRREPLARPVPQWWKDTQTRARAFVKFIKEGQKTLDFTPVISAEEYSGMSNYKKHLARLKAYVGSAIFG